jgi:hypothetical protein
MAFQFSAVNKKRKVPREIDVLLGRQSLLPQMIANKRYKDELTRQEELDKENVRQFEESHAIDQSNLQLAQEQQKLNEQDIMFRHDAAKDQRKMANEQARVGAGLEASKLGLSVADRFGDRTLGEMGALQNVSGGASFVKDLSVGGAVGGALTGFGANKLLGTKKKAKKVAVGIGAGALMGALSGGLNPGSIISGGFGGGIGGFF